MSIRPTTVWALIVLVILLGVAGITVVSSNPPVVLRLSLYVQSPQFLAAEVHELPEESCFAPTTRDELRAASIATGGSTVRRFLSQAGEESFAVQVPAWLFRTLTIFVVYRDDGSCAATLTGASL